MGDIISRADAICEVLVNDGIDNIVDRINALPSAEAVPWSVADKIREDRERLEERVSELEERLEWIPCSERLPNEDSRYLVVYPLIGGGNWISIKWFGKPNMPNRPIKGKCFYESDSEYGDVIWDNVIAWMPLPKPYKGGDDE